MRPNATGIIYNTRGLISYNKRIREDLAQRLSKRLLSAGKNNGKVNRPLILFFFLSHGTRIYSAKKDLLNIKHLHKIKSSPANKNQPLIMNH